MGGRASGTPRRVSFAAGRPRHRSATPALVGFAFLGISLVTLGPMLGREFFPEVDAGAFEIAVRAPTGTRLERTEESLAEVENFIRENIPEHDLQMIVAQIGVSPDISSAYTPNAGPMDAIVKVQLKEHRQKSAQQFVQDGAIMAVETLAGKEIGYFISNLNEGVRDVSPTERVFISQSLLEPLLKARA